MAIGEVGARTKRVDSNIEAVNQDGREMNEEKKEQTTKVRRRLCLSRLHAPGLGAYSIHL